MAFIIKTARTLRNHWKKSTFAAVVLTYATKSTKNYFDTQDLMQLYCEKAAKYGNESIPVHVNPRSITVILNPNANKRKAADEFEKYCAPLLHLAGICVDIVKTESEGHAKRLMESLSNTEAVVVAGGDGTLSEVVTGLLRRTEENSNSLVPIGVLPLGKCNSVGTSMFPGGDKLSKVRSLADATMAVIEEVTKPVDVMKIEVVEDDNLSKPVYAVSSINWGAYRDAEAKKDNYWYFGSLRKYATYIFNGYKNSLSWQCEALVNYTPPCEGCSNCFQRKNDMQNSKWFHKFMKVNTEEKKYQQITNPECAQSQEMKIITSDMNLLTSNILQSSVSSPTPKLQLNIGPKSVDYLDFVKEGWRTVNGETRKIEKVIEARTVVIEPAVLSQPDRECWFSIDNENFEVKPIKITLLPKVINMFCKKENTI